jgi:hypothetical protein
MKLMYLLQIIFRCFLLALAVYHGAKREARFMKSALLVFAMTFLPALIHVILRVEIDSFSILIYLVILFMTLYLGGSLGYYDRFSWWDRITHFLSGAAFVGFGIATIRAGSDITKILVILFGFNFSITLHVFWEVLEYVSDCVLHGNAQRWQKFHINKNHVSNIHLSEKAIQPAGLVDTMNDFNCCIVGAVLASAVWWFFL